MLGCLTGILFSCSEDDLNQLDENQEKLHHHNVSKEKVTFQDMKRFLEKHSNYSLPSSLSFSLNKGENQYITHIDSTKITQIVNDSITSFTLHINTVDDELYAFSNLVIKSSNGKVQEFIYHYNPTTEWLSTYNSGIYLPYDGDLEITNASGQKIAPGPCETLVSIRIPCTGNSETCPCTDGSGQVLYVTREVYIELTYGY